MARKVIGFDVTGIGENLKNAGSTEKNPTGGSSSKGNYKQPGSMNKSSAMKSAKGYIDADGKSGENQPKVGGKGQKGMGYTSKPKFTA